MRLIIPQSRIVKGSVDSTGIGRDEAQKGFCAEGFCAEGFCSSLTENTQYARFLIPISKLTIVFVVIPVFNRGTLSLYGCHIIFIFRDKPW
jgi:hypothetical protein